MEVQGLCILTRRFSLETQTLGIKIRRVTLPKDLHEFTKTYPRTAKAQEQVAITVFKRSNAYQFILPDIQFADDRRWYRDSATDATFEDQLNVVLLNDVGVLRPLANYFSCECQHNFIGILGQRVISTTAGVSGWLRHGQSGVGNGRQEEQHAEPPDCSKA
ncbi:MAG: hypothetical protein OXS33_05285 [bacterium]|nr:hypothetical protein [bacterium]